MRKKTDLTGKKYGKLTILKEGVNPVGSQKRFLQCVCDCGNIANVQMSHLTTGHTKSCGKCPLNSYYDRDGYMVGVTTKGEEFFFDKEDLYIVRKYNWFINDKGYPSTKVGYKHLVLHRLLLGKLDRKHIDHANLVKSDNRRKNLRFCEPIQNCMNRPKRKNASSIYKGVHWDKYLGKWRARITYKQSTIGLGSYALEEEAALAYNKAASFYFEEFANLNVIESKPLNLDYQHKLKVVSLV